MENPEELVNIYHASNKFLHGKLNFIERNVTRKVVLIDHSTDPYDIVEFFKIKWKFKKPGLMMTVTGGTKNFRPDQGLRNLFKQGLMEVAINSNAVIWSGDSHYGVAAQTGQAMNNYSKSITGMHIPCIRFRTTWI